MSELKVAAPSHNNFPSITNWIKNKVSIDPDYIKNILGSHNYKNFRDKISESRPNLSETEFADILIIQLEILRSSSLHQVEKNVAESIISALYNRHDIEKKDYINKITLQQTFNNNVAQKVETYCQLLDCSAEEFMEPIRNGFNSQDNEIYAMTKFAEFKKSIFLKYAEIENQPYKNDEQYISILMNLKNQSIKDMIKNIEKKEAKLVRGNDVLFSTIKFKLSDIKREIDSKCCSICCDDYNDSDELLLLECTHMFHIKCIEEWFIKQTNCPNCRN